MNIKCLLLLSTLSSFLIGFPTSVKAQICSVTATASPNTLPCGGGLVDLNAVGSGGVNVLMNNDFNGGSAGPGWNVSPAGTFNNPCGPSLDGTTYMWMGNTTAAPRTLQSAGLDVSCGGDICFDLRFAIQGGASPCEGPDLAGEGVYLQYSINGGASFVDINYFQPNTGTNAYTNWANFCFPIPAAAQTGNTIFQWYQSGSSGTCCDHWGIDNVTITAQSCLAYYYDWLHIPGSPDNPAQNGVNVTSDTTFTVLYTNGTSDTCMATVTVTINGMGAPTVAITPESCLGDNDGTINLTPQGGVGPYTFDLTGPSGPQSNASGSFSNLIPGTYSVLVTDLGSGCSFNQTPIDILAGAACCPGTLYYTSIESNLICNGDNSGQIILSATGGDGGPYNYSIDNGANFQAGSTFSGLAAGTYDVYITDNTFCLATGQIIISEPAPLSMTFSTFDATCNMSCDGSAIVIPAGGTGGYAYSWNGQPSGPSAQLNGLCAGSTYTLTITDANTCTLDTNNFVINEPPPFSIATSATDANCSNSDGTATVDNVSGGAGGYTYLWDVNAGNQTTATASSLPPGNYDVSVTDVNGCITTVNVPVGNTPGNVAQLVSTSDALCKGSNDGVAEVTSTGGNAPYTYLWDAAAGNQTTAIATGLPAGSFNVVITDVNGCFDDITVTIGEPTQVTATVSMDTIICENGTATLTSSGAGGTGGGYTYLWDDPNASITSTLNVNPGTPSVYNVIVSDANGCPSMPATTVVNYHPPLQVIGLTDISVCPGDPASISAIASGGIGNPYSYTWDNGLGAGQLHNVNPTTQTSYTVTASDGCETTPVTAVVTISMFPVPQPALVADNLADCNPLIANFTNNTDPNLIGASCIWDFGDGTFVDDCGVPTHTYTVAGCYDVSLTVTSPDGCVGSVVMPQYLCAFDDPIPDFEFGPQPTTILDPEIFFTNLTTGADTYYWTFDGLGTSTEQNPVFEFPSEEAGSYEVCLSASNMVGCESSICKTVIIDGTFVIYVPNAFTPDNDGINDFFFATGKGLNSQKYSMQIFDRWGNLVFEASSPETVWDGNVKGIPGVTDVYTWKIVTQDPFTNEEKTFNGHVTLLR